MSDPNCMRLESLFDLYFGGAGSGCHGPNCGRPKGVTETRQVLYKSMRSFAKDDRSIKLANKAIDLMARHRIDSRLLKNKPIGSFVHSNEVDPRGEAYYSPHSKAVEVFHGGNEDYVVHEMGHHIDYTWLKASARDRESEKINEEKVAEWMRAVEREHQRKVDEFVGDKDPKKAWQNISNKGIPSAYALYNKEEWFAESFWQYFKDNERLQRVAPVTHGVLKKILAGEMFE